MATNWEFKSNSTEVKAALSDAVSRALEKCGLAGEGYAKKNLTDNGSVDTGNLRNSISHMVKDNAAYIGTNVSYAPYVEYGHHQTPGRYVAAIKKRLVKSWVPPKPFLRPAANNHADEYKAIFETELNKGD